MADYDVGDKTAVKKRKSKATLARERAVEELKQVLSTVGGRYTIWRLLSECGIFRANPGRPDPILMASFEGGRDKGLWLLNEVFEAEPTAFTKMRAEAEERENG